MVWNYQDANCSIRNKLYFKFTVLFITVFGTLSFPIDTELQCVQCANRHAMTAIYRPTTAVTDNNDIALVLHQNRLLWYGHVLRKEDDDWVKKCMEYEVEGPRPRGRPKRTWREVVREDWQHVKRTKRIPLIVANGERWQRMSDDQDGCE